MTYKKKFQSSNNTSGQLSPISGNNSNQGSWNNRNQVENNITPDQFGYKNYGSRLPEVYIGHPNRIDRYSQYELMDIDAEINACLDIIAEFCTQKNEQNKTPFDIEFTDEPTPHEVELLKKQLQQWCKLNEFDTRAFKIFRNTLKYGDQVFVRDPENFKLYWVDMTKVTKVIVNESEGKKPEQYVIKDLNINLENLSVAQKVNTDFAVNPATGSGGVGGGMAGGGYTVPMNSASGGRFTMGISESAVDAKHIVHLSLTEGLDRFWPFGQSILEMIFKVFKQKELLEDAVLIYRVQRAPERRVFKIDVGNMPSHMAMAFVERVKNEIHQRRIPSTQGNGSIMDATYNPMCLSMDTRVPLLDGRTLSITDLAAEYESGKENWVYSCDPITGKLMHGNITWAGVTRKCAQVIKFTFSNEKSLICTPDHKLVSATEGFVEAKDLEVGRKMMSMGLPLEIKNIEWLDDKDDTGCITVVCDGDHHTFAIESGIFVKNSMNEDYFFPVGCLTLDTTVPLLDGRTLTLSDLIDEFSNGKENYTYSINQQTQKMEPGKIAWCGITRKNAEIVEVLLDNGEKIRATPDHRFIMRDGTEKEAQFLQSMDSLMPLYLNEAKTSPKQKGKPYLRHVDNSDGKIKWVHTTICPKVNPGKDYEIHHLDYNSRNNNPTNLVEMETTAHRHLHKENGTYSLQKQWNNAESREKLILGMKKLYDGASEEFSQALSERNRKNTLSARKNPEYVKKNDDRLRLAQKKVNAARKIKYSFEMLNCVSEAFDSGFDSLPKITPFLGNNEKFQQIFLETNPDILRDKGNMVFAPGEQALKNIVSLGGFTSWGDYKSSKTGRSRYSNNVCFNHKVVSVTFLQTREDTGDLTIETASGNHNFALGAGVYVHNSDGRGSEVTTLPGGQNLSEIDDLRWFNNKMARGLRVPSSYLPTGPDDQQGTLNDGKVGTAMIQEFRFNQYCERLQRYISQKFDEEFKLFLRWRGLNVDSGLFTLNFNPPQNFASYRQSEMDTARVNTYTTMEALPYISKRFAMERFLGLTKEEIADNEKMWHEENSEAEDNNPSGSDLRNVGVSAGDLQTDTDTAENMETPPEEGDGMPPEGIAPVNPPIAGAAGGAGSATGM